MGDVRACSQRARADAALQRKTGQFTTHPTVGPDGRSRCGAAAYTAVMSGPGFGRTRRLDALTIGTAIDGSDLLASLTRRARESQQRLADLQAALPPGLRGRLRAGTLDEQSWTLLAPDAAAAAKLRQLLPRLNQMLAERGWAERSLRVKIRGGDAA